MNISSVWLTVWIRPLTLSASEEPGDEEEESGLGSGKKNHKRVISWSEPDGTVPLRDGGRASFRNSELEGDEELVKVMKMSSAGIGQLLTDYYGLGHGCNLEPSLSGPRFKQKNSSSTETEELCLCCCCWQPDSAVFQFHMMICFCWISSRF